MEYESLPDGYDRNSILPILRRQQPDPPNLLQFFAVIPEP